METKYFNDAIIGNNEMLASYTKNGELLRMYSPMREYKQFIEFFHTGVKINDSNIIYTHDDINNIYDQNYVEDTNILNTEIRNTYFNLKINQTDFVLMKKNMLMKKYKFINENTIDLDVKFLIHSKLISNENDMVSCTVIDDGMIQYNHDYSVCTFAINKNISSHQIHNTKNNILTANISDKDYIGMSSDSSIAYDMGTIKPGEEKTLEILIYINENKDIYNLSEIEKEIGKIKKFDIEKEYKAVKSYWKKYLKEHLTIGYKEVTNQYEAKIQNILKRSILLFPLLSNPTTGGIIASVEIDEQFENCGRYAYCWPRDAVFITKALDILDMKKESEKFYKVFCKNTQSSNGMWEQRFFTDGRLAPCWGYQIDETASVVHGVYEHYKVVKDVKFLKDTLKMCEKAIKFLQKYVEDIISGENKFHISYDLWEMNEGVHLYSLASIVSAFEAFIKIDEEVFNSFDNNRIKQEKLRNQKIELEKNIKEIKKYILDNLYNDGQKSLLRNLKDTKTDISVLGAVVPFNLFGPNEKKVLNTVERINMTLRTYTGGYLRFEGDHYMGGENPWPIATLWMALYYIEAGKKAEAKECFDYVVRAATKHGFIPEQVDNQTMDPAWVNALGWSHAMFVNVLSKIG